MTAADFMDREGSQSSYQSEYGYRSETPSNWYDTEDETVRARRSNRVSDDDSDPIPSKTDTSATIRQSREIDRKRDRNERSREETKESKRPSLSTSKDGKRGSSASRTRRSVSRGAGATPPAPLKDRRLSIPSTDRWADDNQPPMTSAQAREDEQAWQEVKIRRHRERRQRASANRALGPPERNPTGARRDLQKRYVPRGDTHFNREGWRRQGNTMVSKWGETREMNNDEKRQYEYLDKGKKDFRKPEVSAKGKATAGQVSKGTGGRPNPPPPPHEPEKANSVKTSTPVLAPQGQKRQPSDSISPIQPKVRAVEDDEMGDTPTVVDRPSSNPNFWELGSTKMMTARVVPSQPHLEGSELDSRDISYLSSHYVEKTDETKMPDIEFVKELDDREIGVSCGMIRICMKKCEKRHIEWWRNFISSVPARVKGGTTYKFLAPGEEEECVFKVNLRDPRFANPDKAETERIIRSNWRRSPIMEAKFRMRIGDFHVPSGTVTVWLYFEKSQNTQQVLNKMKYTVQYGLERFLIKRATRMLATINDGSKGSMVDKEGDKSASSKSPIKKHGHWEDDRDIDLESALVQSLLNPSDSEASDKVKKRQALAGKQVTEAIAKALSTHANEGTSEEGIRSVASNVYEAVKNTMEVIANDFGDDLDGQDWQLSENDLDKVADKVTEMSTWTEGDMDTRQSSSNPLIGPTAPRQDQAGPYVPPDLDKGEKDPPADDDLDTSGDQDMVEGEATLKQ